MRVFWSCGYQTTSRSYCTKIDDVIFILIFKLRHGCRIWETANHAVTKFVHDRIKENCKLLISNCWKSQLRRTSEAITTSERLSHRKKIKKRDQQDTLQKRSHIKTKYYFVYPCFAWCATRIAVCMNTFWNIRIYLFARASSSLTYLTWSTEEITNFIFYRDRALRGVGITNTFNVTRTSHPSLRKK